MPTFATSKKNASTEEESSSKVNDENPRKGADLLLSLSAPPKAAQGKSVITPQEGVVMAATREHSFSMPSGFPVGLATSGASNHRLYHSPIKVNAASAAAPLHPANAAGDPGSSYPAWSPSYANGMVPVYHASFGNSPSNAFVKESVAGSKRQVSDLSETSEAKRSKAEQGQPKLDPTGKNRIISPSSSNERSEDDAESAATDPRTAAPTQQYVPPSGFWQQQPGAAPANGLYPPLPPPQFAAGFASAPPSAFPPHWGMYGAAAPPPPPQGMYPPFLPHHPDQAKPPSQTTAAAASSQGPSPDCDDWKSHVASSTYNRCIPLKHPLPSRFWGNGEALIERKLPDFSRLVNFPDYLARGRKGEAQTIDGKKHCVMCGKLRICSASSLSRTAKKDTAESTDIIPRQNKGVCTACDIAVWHVADQNYEIKWCKGCKNFRPWAAFGDKGLATKCARCRQRQKEKYANQKNENRLSGEKKEDDTRAARGVRKVGGA